MTPQEIHIKQYEAAIEDSRKELELFDALQALEKNKHFKKLIHEVYFRDLPVNLVMQRAEEVNLGNEEFLHTNNEIMNGIARFRNFLFVIYAKGQKAKQEIEVYEAEIAAIQSGEYDIEFAE